MYSFAYLDPSVATYLIQAGTGVVVAVGAFIGMYIRKLRRKSGKKKEVEKDEIIIKDGK